MKTTGAALALTLAGSLAAPAADEAPARARRVGLVIYQNMEILDFAGPAEVFQASGPAFEVYTIAQTREPVVSQRFVTIVPQYTIADAPRPDILVLPGGGTGAVRQSPAMLEWVGRTARQAVVVLSVCTGAFVLADAGFLDGLEATTWHGAIERLREAAPKTRVLEKVRFVDNGHIVTTAGVSAGIDGALHVVSRLLGPERAHATAHYMEYDKWVPEAGRVVAAAPRRESSLGTGPDERARRRRAVRDELRDGLDSLPVPRGGTASWTPQGIPCARGSVQGTLRHEAR